MLDSPNDRHTEQDQLRTPPASARPEHARRFAIRDEVAIQDFDDGSLVLLCEQLRLVQLNPTARDIVGRLDGARSVLDVAQAVAGDYDEPLEVVLADVAGLLTDLERQGVVERCSDSLREE